MSKWYLKPQNKEFSEWHPRAMSKAIGNVSVQVVEPQAAIHSADWSLLPLTDNGPTLGTYQRVASRTITDDGETATAEYTVEDMPLEEAQTLVKARAEDEYAKLCKNSFCT